MGLLYTWVHQKHGIPEEWTNNDCTASCQPKGCCFPGFLSVLGSHLNLVTRTFRSRSDRLECFYQWVWDRWEKKTSLLKSGILGWNNYTKFPKRPRLNQCLEAMNLGYVGIFVGEHLWGLLSSLASCQETKVRGDMFIDGWRFVWNDNVNWSVKWYRQFGCGAVWWKTLHENWDIIHINRCRISSINSMDV